MRAIIRPAVSCKRMLCALLPAAMLRIEAELVGDVLARQRSCAPPRI